jgi:hypothetical protein
LFLMTSLMNAAWTKCLKVSSYWDCEIAFGVAGMDSVEEAEFRPLGFEDDSKRDADLK